MPASHETVLTGAVERAQGLAEASARPFPYNRRAWHNGMMLGIGEATALLLAFLLGGFIRWAWKGSPMIAPWMGYFVVGWLAGSAITRRLPGWGLGAVEELRRTVLLLSGVFSVAVAVLFLTKAADATSRFTLTTGFLFSLPLVPLHRLQMKRMLIRRGTWGAPTVIYGDERTATRVVEALHEERGLGYTPRGVFMNPVSPPPHTVAGLPVLGVADQHAPDASVAVVCMGAFPRDRFAEMVESSLSVYRRVLVIPDLFEAPSLWARPRDLMGMLGIEIPSNLLDPLARVLKRGADLLFVAALAPLWAPLSALLGLLVWLEDRADPLFLQERVGRDGHRFMTWKFRTMHPDAEGILQQQLEQDQALRDEWLANFKLRHDPRVTRIGAFLRRTSLDELPQLVNVLRGEMALVGPRPLPAYHYEELPERVRKLRDRVRPGVTGLWQVSGRSEAGHAGMSRWDAYYVRNWSIWLDIVIFVRTVRTVVTGHGAF
jgi:Undecaprenyl-phosphate galactose phosphotransferase WbaP